MPLLFPCKGCQMNDREKTKEQLIQELAGLRQRLAELATCDLLLDFNMPKKDGRHTLAEIKQDKDLRRTPVVVLTSSDSEDDIHQVYELNANCYVTKPADFGQFCRALKSVLEFWLNVAELPTE